MNREEILGIQDVKIERVAVPEWGCVIKEDGTDLRLYVRGLTGAERDQFEQANYKLKGKKFELNIQNVRARLVCLTLVDELGNRVFKDGDEPVLGGKNAAALNRPFEVAQRLSGLTKEDLEELAGNSEPGTSVSTASA